MITAASIPPHPERRLNPDAPTPILRAPILGVHGLAGQRGQRPLFRGLSLSLQPGELVWLRGRNGCGKTSLLRLLAGLSTPVRGEVLLDGVPLRQAAAAGRGRLNYVAHANALKDDLTVSESLSFFARLQGGAPTPGDIHKALDTLGIAALANAFVRTLSQGQRRRVALARLALSQPPSVWLLDEPFDALDADGVRALHALLATQVARGGSALLTSHQHPGLTPDGLRTVNLDDYAVSS